MKIMTPPVDERAQREDKKKSFLSNLAYQYAYILFKMILDKGMFPSRLTALMNYEEIVDNISQKSIKEIEKTIMLIRDGKVLTAKDINRLTRGKLQGAGPLKQSPFERTGSGGITMNMGTGGQVQMLQTVPGAAVPGSAGGPVVGAQGNEGKKKALEDALFVYTDAVLAAGKQGIIVAGSSQGRTYAGNLFRSLVGMPSTQLSQLRSSVQQNPGSSLQALGIGKKPTTAADVLAMRKKYFGEPPTAPPPLVGEGANENGPQPGKSLW